MDIAIMLEGQEGLTYAELLAMAQRAEQQGLAGLYRSDHYSSVAHRTDLGSTDAWATLGGLARETQHLRFGTLVSPATFRPPAVVAKMAATVWEMAGPAPAGSSRVTLGMGTGWHDSLMTGCLIGATESEFRDRARLLLERQGDHRPVDDVLDQWSDTWVMGTPEQARDRLGELAAAGVECVMLQHLLHDDLEMVDLITDELTD